MKPLAIRADALSVATGVGDRLSVTAANEVTGLGGRLLRTPAQRFAAKVRVLDSGCHIWQGCRTRGGYGQFRLGDDVVYAHRFAYEQAFGAIAPDLQCDHICNVTLCVNPLHLQCVTQEQNLMLARVRAGYGDIYLWEDALDAGLAVELDDLLPDGPRARRAAARLTW